MTPAPDWNELLDRLESDLRARTDPSSGTPDDQAWRELREFIRSNVRRFFARDLPSIDPEDVLQAVLLKLQSLVAIRRLRLAGSPGGYLAVMIRNMLNDASRKRRLEIESLIGLARVHPAPDQQEPHGIDIRKVRLRAELNRLSAEDRTLLRMRFWRGLSLREIADEMGQPYSATAMKMFRLLQWLKQQLTEGGA